MSDTPQVDPNMTAMECREHLQEALSLLHSIYDAVGCTPIKDMHANGDLHRIWLTVVAVPDQTKRLAETEIPF